MAKSTIPTIDYSGETLSPALHPAPNKHIVFSHGHLVHPIVAAGGIEQTSVEEAIPTGKKKRRV